MRELKIEFLASYVQDGIEEMVKDALANHHLKGGEFEEIMLYDVITQNGDVYKSYFIEEKAKYSLSETEIGEMIREVEDLLLAKYIYSKRKR